MKTFHYFALMLVLTFSFATTCEEEVQPVNLNPELYLGKWQLANVSGGIENVNQNFAENEIVWEFLADGSVTVENNFENDAVEDFMETGSYTYFIESARKSVYPCGYLFWAGDNNLGCMTARENKIVFKRNGSDGYVLTFQRVTE
ncbi:MAG: hypothetical protein EOO45_17380 [Flavobacterium sp.]|nr:MAG: hypothetical protein EOO45_17380 [Flavobacterium sp.]